MPLLVVFLIHRIIVWKEEEPLCVEKGRREIEKFILRVHPSFRVLGCHEHEMASLRIEADLVIMALFATCREEGDPESTIRLWRLHKRVRRGSNLDGNKHSGRRRAPLLDRTVRA